jgi:hypothetical protein
MKREMVYRVGIFLAVLVFSGAVMALVSKTTIDDGTITTGNVTAIEVNVDEVSGHTVTGDIDMDGHRITNLGEPVDGQDIATKNYVDTILSS